MSGNTLQKAIDLVTKEFNQSISQSTNQINDFAFLTNLIFDIG